MMGGDTVKALAPCIMSIGDWRELSGSSQPQARREPEPRAWLLCAAALVLLGALLRAGVAVWVFPVTPLGDELYYSETAIHIARGEGHTFGPHGMKARWPPGQAVLLAPFVDLDLVARHPDLLPDLARRQPAEMEERHRRFLRPLVAVEVVLGTLVVALTAGLARLLFDRRTALVAAALAACYPALVTGSHYLWSETLFTVLLLAALVAAVAWERRQRLSLALAAGACFGLAALTRELALPIGGAMALWWILTAGRARRGRATAHAALLMLAMVLVVLPWTLRNQRQFGRVVPVSTVGWMGLREGNTLAADALFERDWEAVRAFRRRYVSIPDEMERMDTARREAIVLIREAQPAWIVRKLVLNVGELFGPGSDVFFKLQQGAYGDVPQPLTRALLVGSVGCYVLVLLAAVLGAAAAPGPGRRTLPLLLFAPVLVVHVIANAFPKYRVPLVPLLVVYAGFALRVGWRGLREGSTPRSRRVAVAVLAVVFGLCLPSFAPRAARLWTRGATPREAPAAAAAPADRPGRIILLSMDTVRADRVSGYGAADTTPAITRIAAEGALFRDFYAASNYTIPSHMSIFTGLDPAEHGVIRKEARLDPAVPTLAELLRDAGYRTRGFHEGGFVESRFGFARGFETYRRYPRLEVVRRNLPSVLEWMRKHRDEPYFLFLHTYAAHFPYGGFERYRREHPERGLPTDEELAELRRRFPGPDLLSRKAQRALPAELRRTCTLYNELAETHAILLPCGGYMLDEEAPRSPHFEADLAAIRRSYDERIRLIDGAVAEIRATLEELGLWEDTLFVITADHGEAFYEHGLARHDYVPFQEVMRVPLVISYPRAFGERGGRVVEGAAWHLDLMRTILRLARVEPPEGVGGIDLSAVFGGEVSLPVQRAVYPVVLRSAHREPLPLRRVTVRGASKRIEGHALFGDERGLLFDLATDPGERRNLRDDRPEEMAALDVLTAHYERGLRQTRPVHQSTGRALDAGAAQPAAELTPELESQLRELGYAQ
jgi:arylsulfatase A-like enzyme